MQQEISLMYMYSIKTFFSFRLGLEDEIRHQRSFFRVHLDEKKSHYFVKIELISNHFDLRNQVNQV